MGWNYSYFPCPNCPVNNLSWFNMLLFIERLNKATNKNFRLPTEAEWAYAAKGGQQSKNYLYSGSNKIDEVAWYAGNANKRSHPVATKKPNELGLYDMTGICGSSAKTLWIDSSIPSKLGLTPYIHLIKTPKREL